MTFIQMIWLEIFSGLVFTMSIPNEWLTFGSPVFAFIALIPHFICIEKSKTLKEAFILCFIQSITCHLTSSFWLAHFQGFAIFTLGASALATAGIHGLFGLIFFIPKYFSFSSHLTKKHFTEGKSFRILWFSAIYTVWEYIKCRGFIAYPWGTVNMSAFSLKLFTQIVDITGVRGITFLFSFFSATAAVFILDLFKYPVKKTFLINKPYISAALLLIVTTEIYGVYQYTKFRIPEKYLNTVFIQQNYDPWLIRDDKFSIAESQELTDKALEELSRENKQADLVVWSEGILHYPFPQGEIHYRFYPEERPLIPYIASTQTPTIIGAPWTVNFEEMKFSNSAIVFDKDGKTQGFFAKIHLVPFAERIPYTQYKLVRELLLKIVGFSYGWVPGDKFKTFDIPVKSASNDDSDYKKNVKISIPICFEDAFPDICRGLKKEGTEVFVNITDDSWSLTKSAEYQHFIIAWYRAMELRTTMLRSTNSGYTVVVDPSGRIQKDLPLFEKTYMNYPVPAYRTVKTFYLIFGEWLSYLCIAFMFIIVIMAVYSLKDRKPSLKSLILKEIYSIQLQ